MNCRHCAATTTASESDARALGWRWYNGLSQTGKPLFDVVCPECAGDISRPLSILEDADKPGCEWAVGCFTCGWEYDSPYEGDPLCSEWAAMREADDHRCEPETWTRQPGGPVKDKQRPRSVRSVTVVGGLL